MAKPLPNYVAGEWRVATTTVPNVNPSNTDDVINEHCFATADDTRAAVEAARAAFPGWARTTPQQRHDVLRRASDEIFARQEELGRLLAREEGKTLPEAVGEVGRAGQIFDFFAGETLPPSRREASVVRPGVEVEINREPLGVIA